jgi:DNA-directed RNA polymerase alpha subunit
MTFSRKPAQEEAPMSSDQTASDFPAKLSKPAQRALAGAGYTRLEQLTRVSEAELLKLHGMGPKALGLLRSALADQGLSFRDSK